MRLRASTRLPGRYREDDIPPLPGTARFVHPTVPYNPNLPKAAFPTLDEPRPVESQPSKIMEVADSKSAQEEPEPLKRATVFHDKRKPPQQLPTTRASPGSEIEAPAPGLKISDAETQMLWLAEEDPGEYGGYGSFSDDERDEKTRRVALPAFDIQVDWSQVTDGLKLIILYELTSDHTFDEAMRLLALRDKEINEIVGLHEQELERKAKEDAKIARSQAHQLEILMNGACTTRAAFSALLEESLYADVEEPAAFMISMKDLKNARRFLRSMNLAEYAERLWRYHGVALSPTMPDVFRPQSGGITSPTGDDFATGEPPHSQELQQPLLRADDKEAGLAGKKRKYVRKSLPKGSRPLPSESWPTKLARADSRIVTLKVPSGLRNAISGNDLEETFATAPAALQSALSPDKPPPRRRLKSKKSEAPKIKFTSQSQAVSPALPNIGNSFDPSIVRTPSSTLFETDNFITRSKIKQVKDWASHHVAPYSPIPPPSLALSLSPSTPSRAPQKQMTAIKLRSAQIGKVLDKNQATGAETQVEAGMREKAKTVFRVPPAQSPLEVLPEKTQSASKHAQDEQMLPNAHSTSMAQVITKENYGQTNSHHKVTEPEVITESQSSSEVTIKKRLLEGQLAQLEKNPTTAAIRRLARNPFVNAIVGNTESGKLQKQSARTIDKGSGDTIEQAMSAARVIKVENKEDKVAKATAAKARGIEPVEQIAQGTAWGKSFGTLVEAAANDVARKEIIGQKRKRKPDTNEDSDS